MYKQWMNSDCASSASCRYCLVLTSVRSINDGVHLHIISCLVAIYKTFNFVRFPCQIYLYYLAHIQSQFPSSYGSNKSETKQSD